MFSGFGVLFGHRGAFACFSGRVRVTLLGSSLGGSGRGRECGSFEEDMRVDECVGEGVEVGDRVDVSLVGDVSSIVLEGGEGAFSDGAGFVDVFEVCGGPVEVESVVVVEVDDTGASVGC